MEIFRRSNLPRWLTGNAHPPKAPKDAHVRDWVRQVKLPDKAVEPVARVMEKELVRRTGTLDFSRSELTVLERLPATLLTRLAAHTSQLLLPDDCPESVAHRLIQELGVQKVSPDALMPRRWKAPARQASTGRRPTAPRPTVPPPPRPTTAAATRPVLAPGKPPALPEIVYDVPGRRYEGDYDLPPARATRVRIPLPQEPRPGTPEIAPPICGIPVPYDVPPRRNGDYDIPRSSRQSAPRPDSPELQRQRLERMPSRVSPVGVDTVHRALSALQLPTAWLSAGKRKEDASARCPLSPDDALALSAALAGLSADMVAPPLQKAFVVAQRLLAMRRPGQGLAVNAEEIGDLRLAVRTVEQLVAGITGESPVLPPRRVRSPASRG